MMLRKAVHLNGSYLTSCETTSERDEATARDANSVLMIDGIGYWL
jgi:hypothetical protein